MLTFRTLKGVVPEQMDQMERVRILKFADQIEKQVSKQLLDTSRCLKQIKKERRELSSSVERWRSA